jgi:two-component system, OmpR family, response regulator
VSLAHIAVLDDDPDVTQLLSTYLQGHGFRVTQVHQGRALLALLQHDPPALVLLDLSLPGEDGLAIARRLREDAVVGLIIVSGRGDAVDKVVGLEIGADDYITKPFDLRELLARVKAVLRRMTTADTAVAGSTGAKAVAAADCLHFAGFKLDRAARALFNVDGCPISLTAGEFDLLSVFAQHPQRVLSRDFLLEATRGREAAPFDRTVDVQMGRLRKKLEANPQDPQLLKSVRAAGYILATSVTLG